LKGHPDLPERYAEAVEILGTDPSNRSRRYAIKKLTGVEAGEGQFRLRPSALATNDHTLLAKSDPPPRRRGGVFATGQERFLPAGKSVRTWPAALSAVDGLHQLAGVLPQTERVTRLRRG